MESWMLGFSGRDAWGYKSQNERAVYWWFLSNRRVGTILLLLYAVGADSSVIAWGACGS
ncbi:MAG: hypothetical protein ACLTJN_00650 [Monoglobus pectinilyticus]